MLSHPFVRPFVVMAVADVAMVLCAAAIRTRVCSRKPLAFHALAVWAVVILLANFANDVAARPETALFAIVAGVAALVTYSRVRTSSAPVLGMREQWRDIGIVITALGLQIALFLVPLLVLPARTLIPGYLVCNDAIMHAITIRGLDFVNGPFAAWHWLQYYPDGFHAVVFAFGPLFRHADIPTLLLPATMWAGSFLALAILMLLHEEGVRKRWATLLIAVSPAAAFIVATSVYLNFVGHVSVLPFLVGCLVMAAAWTPADLRDRGLLLALLPVAAAGATYGLLALTAIGLAVALRMAWEIRQPARLLTLIGDTARSLGRPSAIVGLLAVVALSVPVAHRIVTGYAFFADQAHTTGNLPNGFLSAFHITGVWKGGIEYRSELPGPQSHLTMILAAVLVGQVWLVARARLSRVAIIPLLTLGLPVVVSAMVVRSPYLNFKYICLFAAVWVPMVMLSLSRAVEHLSKGHAALSNLTLAAAMLLVVVESLGSYRLLPALPDFWFREMAVVRAEHFSRGPVLVLSKEDWFHYYRDSDDIVPLTYMFAQPYERQPMREVLVDSQVQKDAEAFLAINLPGSVARLTVCHADVVGARYHFYRAACLTGDEP